MKGVWKSLNHKLPDGCASFPRLLLALGMLILLVDVVGVLPAAFDQWETRRGLVALVGPLPVSAHDLADAMRSSLWRSGQTWKDLSQEEKTNLRESSLGQLIYLRRLNRLMVETGGSPPRRSAEAFQQFLKQFEGDEWKQRAEWQGLSEADLQRRIGSETAEVWTLEQELAERSGQVAEPKARQWYETHKEAFIDPERMRASHIFLSRHDAKNPDRSAEIGEIHRQLVAKEATFSALAAKHSDDERSKKVGGDLGWFSRGRAPADFADKVFGLPVGSVSAPFLTKLGWHIVIVHEKRSAKPLTFDEAKPEIEAMLMDEQRRTALKALMKDWETTARVQRFEDHITKVEPAP